MDEVYFRGNFVIAKTDEGRVYKIPVTRFVQLLRTLGGTDETFIQPDGLRFTFRAGRLTIFVLEFSATPRTLTWISEDSPAPYGPRARYRRVYISLPYIVVLAMFQDDLLSAANECFFRSQPIVDPAAQTELFFPALLNCSRFKPPDRRPLSWICTQHLKRHRLRAERHAGRRIYAGLHALQSCLFDTGFNYSSEHHEYSSWYTESRSVDPRITTIGAWERATRDDRMFALDVPWLTTGMTIAQVVDRMFHNQGAHAREIQTSLDVARIIVNHAKQEKP